MKIDMYQNARKLFRQLIAVSPFALVIGVGVETKSVLPPHEFLVSTAKEDERISAYANLTTLADGIGTDGQYPSLASLRAAAGRWITAKKTAKLQPLYASFEEQGVEDGPRSEVLLSWSNLTGQLVILCTKDIVAKRYSAWVSDSQLTIGILETLKYSDLRTLTTAARLEVRLAKQFAMVRQNLEINQVDRFKVLFTDASQTRKQAAILNRNLRKNFYAFMVRQKTILTAEKVTELDVTSQFSSYGFEENSKDTSSVPMKIFNHKLHSAASLVERSNARMLNAIG